MENLTNQPPKPDNYLVWAILSTIFCCLPLGIISIVKSTKVNELYAQGNFAEAQQAAQEAKKWAMWSALGWLLLIVIPMVILLALGVFGAILDSGY
ncbi:CD225/dispanin family protein [Marixanthomonas ophiurae]|uniref:CD225/dispanin family protein n=1 Tax=Marixanthomonas ophiurae TaxID=387659 RepID=A0A3E1QB34_9FLAO|nr:CD225/dispanin family protein [Marixanthomonas ophiurae]RFN59314.1 CD225/dispanin family protein [Marixanthomonas ophiurae]